MSDAKVIALHQGEARRVAGALTRAALAAARAWRRSPQRRAKTADASDDVLTPDDAARGAAFVRRAVLSASATLGRSPRLAAALRELGEGIALAEARASVSQMLSLGASWQALAERLRIRVATPPTAPGQLPRLAAIDVASTPERLAVLESWAADNLSLISTYPTETIAGLETVIAEQMRAGARWTTLERELRERAGMTERHARLVARDQAGKLQSAVANDLQRSAGVKRYRWRTARDSRVRDAHRRLEGQVFELDGPGAPGAGPYGQPAHPGEGIQCRCRREPVVDDVPGLSRPERVGFPVVREGLVRPPGPGGAIPRAIRTPGGRPRWTGR